MNAFAAIVIRLMVLRNAMETEFYNRIFLIHLDGETGRKWNQLMEEGYTLCDVADWSPIGTNMLVKWTYETQMEYIRPGWGYRYSFWDEGRYDEVLNNYGIRSVSFASHRLRRARRRYNLVGGKVSVINGTATQKAINWLKTMNQEIERHAFATNLILTDMDNLGQMDESWDEYGSTSLRDQGFYEAGSFAFQNAAQHRTFEWDDLEYLV